MRQIARSGGHVYRQYHAINAFAAKVSASERAALSNSAAVAQIVPDSLVKLSTPLRGAGRASKAPRATPAPGTTTPSGQQICGTASNPLLEPEALQTTHTAFNDPNTPQAANIVDGAGVKVATFADGLDINNPDLIRSNGQHVVRDYQDFSGDGPNAPSNSLEAFGDVSSIAAQGNVTYDISQFNNPAHPLPAGCDIKVRGIAPGVTLYPMKVFGNSDFAFNSQILEGLDWALSVDHVNVFSESFGANPIPDTTQDITRQFNEQAVAAGATVVESSGDAGALASPSSAASDPDVIDAAASTTFRNYALGVQYGFQFANGWLSDNISSISQGGITQGGRTPDLVAPGEANWALCSAKTAIYLGCVNFAGQPTNLESFGGTSESAPLIAGGAALVIEAYRNAHNGATPSASLVRQLLTSTSTDLGEPGTEQGAGEMNTLAAVQAAETVGNTPSAANGSHLLVGPNQIELSGNAGSQVSETVQVTNLGTTTQIVHAHARAITSTVKNQTGSVNINSSDPTFVDQFGAARPYQMIHFNVPAGHDRLLADIAWPGGTSRVGLTLIDPNGNFAAYTRPQGDGNHGQVDVTDPVGGTWTGLIFLRDGTLQPPGKVLWQMQTQDFGTVDSVSPSAQQIAPGKSKSFTFSATLPTGDRNDDIEIDGNSDRTIVPAVLRGLVGLGRNGGSFSGTLIGGNGRSGRFFPGQIDTYDFNVPAGEPELSVAVTFDHNPGTELTGTLIDPTGNAVTVGDNVHFNIDTGTETFTSGLQVYAPSPRSGEWRFVVDDIVPSGGQVLQSAYNGQVSFAPPPVTASGLPNSASRTLPAGKPHTVTVSVNNNGVGTEDFFLDPRLPKRQEFSLLTIDGDTNLALPLQVNPPLYFVPTETNRLDAVAQANEPVQFDWGYNGGDPDLGSVSSGDSATGTFTSKQITPAVLGIEPVPTGPFPNGAPAGGKVSTALIANTRGFDLNSDPSTGDIWEQTVDPNAGAFTPVTLSPGQHGTMTVTITPSGKSGKTVSGTLYVDVWSGELGVGGEVVALPYEYTIK
ncbi:MAG: S8 family serine peptidase [Solirubrobacteraceae bacterium]